MIKKLKKLLLICIVSAGQMAALYIILGCSEDTPSTGSAYALKYVTNYPPIDGCCNEIFIFDIVQTIEPGCFYNIVMQDINSMTVWKSSIEWMSAYQYEQRCTVSVSYSTGLTFLDSGPYFFTYFTYKSDGEPFYISNTESVTVNIPAEWDRNSCEPICCTGDHYYAQIYKEISGLTAASAKIEAVITSQLCGYGRFGEPVYNEAHSCALVGIAYEPGPLSQLTAQIGWTITRDTAFEEFYEPRVSYYGELRNKITDSTKFYFYADLPNQGDEDEYYLELNQSIGQWRFEFYNTGKDTTIVGILVDTFWTGKTGQSVIWGGEVLNFEDDMPGLSANQCKISECAYYHPNEESADFTTELYDYYRTDETEWQIQVFDNTTLLLWDKNRSGP